MEQFTKNFSYDELIASATAKRLGLDNTPTLEEKEKLRRAIEARKYCKMNKIYLKIILIISLILI